MVFRCCLKHCSSRGDFIKMHSFPKDKEFFVLWIKAIHRHDLLEFDLGKVRKNYRVCDLHFSDNLKLANTDHRSRTNLKLNVVPDRNLEDCFECEQVENQMQMETVHQAAVIGRIERDKFQVGSKLLIYCIPMPIT